ncbi:MAG: M20/M25/M40 family metallo-hydrolase [Kiritimatiellaeota bacterium]|nr:M20/M25/M40 family metallo-hydrolase [Kiritimatiellota bacterium]
MDTRFAADYFDAHRGAVLEEWFELLRLPTVGADPRRLGDCARAAAWLKKFLRPMGFEVEIVSPPSLEGERPREPLETERAARGDTRPPVPVLLAERQGERPGMTVLFYGHYDVQPEDPVAEWRTPPFEPSLLDGRVYARGAQDNKGQLMGFLMGVRALVEAGVPLPTLKVVLEGQEESGSGVLTELAPSLALRLQADVLMACDTSSGPGRQPAITAGLRGVQHLTVTLTGPAHDLHSGVHGGVAPNPAQGLARLLASLHRADGSIAVKGFCDNVEPPSEEERAMAMSGGGTEEQYAAEVGCPPWGGAQDADMVTRGSFLPTIEINGVHSGYGGPGSKTVIPSAAVAKISARLVPGQSPPETFAALVKHLEAHCPRGMRLAVSDTYGGAPGFRLPLGSPVFRLAEDVLGRMDARGALFRWEGASIPIISTLRHISGAAPLLVGFGSEDDRIHSPNESFGVDQFVHCMTWATLMLDALAS